jgi:hypothetical protein
MLRSIKLSDFGEQKKKHHCFLPAVNFINVFCVLFLYKSYVLAAFSSCIYIEKAAETNFHSKKRARLMQMKLTPGGSRQPAKSYFFKEFRLNSDKKLDDYYGPCLTTFIFIY